MLLSHYCSSIPYTDNATIGTKKYYGIRMDTRAYPIFTYLYDIFYKYEFNVGHKKVVPPSEYIYDLLSPVALAY
jgi:hypothetical protein